MNRKFSTLLAGVALMSAFTMQAQDGSSNAYYDKAGDGKVIELKDIKSSVYYLLTAGSGASTSYLTVGEIDGKPALIAEETLEFGEDYDRMLWSITKGVKDPASGIATYVYTNKATGQVINFDKANKTKPILVEGTSEWSWAGNKITHAGKGMGIKVDGTTVEVVGATSSEATEIKAKTSNTYYLKAEGLNALYGNRFELQIANDLANNPFSTYQLKATDVKNDGTFGPVGDAFTDKSNYVTLKALNALGKTKKDGKINNDIYVSVDTTLYARSGIQTIAGTDGIGYKLALDTMVYNKAPGATDNWLQSYKPAYMYNFRFTYDPSAKAESALKIEVVTPVKQYKENDKDISQKERTAFVTGLNDDGTFKETSKYAEAYKDESTPAKNNYLSWAIFEGGTKYLTTSVTGPVEFPSIGFKAGVIANIPAGAYYIVDAKETLQEYSTDESQTRPIVNPNKGKAYVMTGCEGEGKIVYNGAHASYLPSTQWSLGGKNGNYNLTNRGYKLVPSEDEEVAPLQENRLFGKTLGKRFYDLGDGKYAILGVKRSVTLGDLSIKDIEIDTVLLVPVEADKYVGYKNFTKEEEKNLVFGLQVSSDIATAFVGSNKNVLNLVNASSLEDGVQKFKIEKVGETFTAATTEGDSLVTSIYALKERFGSKYLALKKGKDKKNKTIIVGLELRDLVSEKEYLVEGVKTKYSEAPLAVAFKNVGKDGEYQMYLFTPEQKTGEEKVTYTYVDGENTKYGIVDYAYAETQIFKDTQMATSFDEIVKRAAITLTAAEKVAVDAATTLDARITALEDGKNRKKYTDYEDNHCTDVVAYQEGIAFYADYASTQTAVNAATPKPFLDAAKVAGSISNATVNLIEKCNTKFDDRFMIESEAMPEYAKVAPGHYNIRTEEDDDQKALTMFSDGYAWLKTAGQQMGDTIVTEENLGMWIAEANVSDVTKPLYYITTARGISAENQKAGLKFHMNATTKKTYADKNRLNFVEATALGDSAIVFAAAPKDSLKLSTAKAGKVVFAFETTPTAGEYLMVVPGLTKKVDTDKNDPWTGKPIQVDGEDTDNYVAVYNNILFLTNKEEAYKFKLNATSKSPVSNEGAAVSSISVSAENGQVTILNATGKKVSITNTLGQTLVNTAITSDRASFGVQTGIVYVQVEGEAAVSVIVK